MPATTTAQIDNAVRKFVAASRYVIQERPGVMKSSIRHEDLPTRQGPNINIPKYNTVTTGALTEGVDMQQAQVITDSNLVLTPAEFGSQVILTDMNLMEAKDEFFGVAGRLLGEGYDRHQDQTLCDDLDNFSLALGSAGTALTVGHMMAAYASIQYNAPADASAGRGGEPAPGPYYAVLTPSQIHALNKNMVGGIGATGATQNAPETGRIGNPGGEFSIPGLVGLTVKSDININKDTSDDAKGGLFSKEALILATLGGGPDAERERDASLRAWEVNYVGRWARGEYNDAWGREMLFDSANPTS